MAIYIKLNIPGIGILEKERLQRRIRFGLEWIKSFEFEIDYGEVWINAPLKELGGELITKFEKITSPEDVVKSVNEEQAENAIVNIVGVLKVDDNEYPSAIAIHNKKSFRKIYGDIEFDTSIKPIEDILMENENLWVLVEKSLKTKIEGVKIESCHIGYSPDALIDVRERLFSYLCNSKDLVMDLIRTLKQEAEEDPTFRRYLKYFRPYDMGFLARKIDSFSEFNIFLTQLAKNSHIVKEEGNSISLRAKEKESFSNFYKNFRTDFLDSIKDEWPDEDQIAGILYRWVGKYKSFDEFVD
ncbi:MAG: hypothetical protein IB616_00925 [Methanosarcinales archaeon]|nr:MAG: hypothetical protein IB616_00925 [Methanosarcinales archaeon]